MHCHTVMKWEANAHTNFTLILMEAQSQEAFVRRITIYVTSNLPYFSEYKSHRSISCTPTKVLVMHNCTVILISAHLLGMRITAHCKMENYSLESVVRGHHVYKSTWTPRRRVAIGMTGTLFVPDGMATL